jgi:hypothetical protein
METALGADVVRHTDGHIISLRLNKHEVEVELSHCPEEGSCLVREAQCVVEYFINTFGLECNVGSAEVASTMEIAWALMGDNFHVQECQLWWIPVEDDAFSSWLSTKLD